MSSVRKILGQLYPDPSTISDLYVVPTGKQAVISTITVCNPSSIQDNFSLSVVQSGGVVGIDGSIFYNVPVAGEDTFVATIGLCLNEGDSVKVITTNGTCAFTATGQEITQ